ncbi:MAG: hypothetical protein K1Y01_00905 [Vicinamibacteria bacterium]|nr:hypothetical protein [Vicinamibacteria bacterium]
MDSRAGRPFAAMFLSLAALTARALQEPPAAPLQSVLGTVEFRNIGPFRAGAWITDIAVPDAPPHEHLRTIYVGTRNGGVFKTTNNGTTFKAVFDAQSHLSIGALAISSSNPRIVWAGTGEAYGARSSYSGDGVYKTTDGGATWAFMGLRDTHHVARIVIHPQKPDIVYVAAMGHLYTANDERGVFKTTDGGKTWRRVLHGGPRVGAVDLVMDPSHPEVLLAATYEMERRPWTLVESGPGSGLHRSTDGGETWTRVAGGLPGGQVGRIGLTIHRADPRIVYALVENANPRPATEEEKRRQRDRDADPNQVYSGQTAHVPVYGGEVYRSNDGGRTWKKTHGDDVSVGGNAMYSFSQIRVDPRDPDRLFVTSDTLPTSIDGGRTWRDLNWPPRAAFAKAFGDYRTLWIDPQDPSRIIAGSDGGLHVSYDGGLTVDHHPNLPIGEIYGLDVDMDDPYNIYAGLQDHESWKGPSNGPGGKVTQDDWVTTGTQDGMYNRVDPTDSRWLYNSYQFGGQHRVDQRLHTKTNIQPRARPGDPPYRFNWITPLALSPHDPKTLYTGAQMLLRSRDRGDTWEEASLDLTTNDAKRIAATGPSIRFCTITTISESPATPGVLWVGTDDGRVQVSEDDGKTWRDVTGAVAAAGGPAETWTSRVFASPHEPRAAYVAKTGYRFDDFTPYLFKTVDAGRTFVRITEGLPHRPVNVIVQDRKNPRLLFAGTDGGVFVSLDDGASWQALRANMPQVAVHDLVVHPRENDLVVGSYGRGIWVGDVSVLQEWSGDLAQQPAHLFGVEARPRLSDEDWGNYELYGDRYITTDNERNALAIHYWLRDEVPSLRITVRDSSGRLMQALDGPRTPGLHRVWWEMTDAEKKRAPAGDYEVLMEAGSSSMRTKARIRERIVG